MDTENNNKHGSCFSPCINPTQTSSTKQFSAVCILTQPNYDTHHIEAFKLKNEIIGNERGERWDRTRSTCTATRGNKILGTGEILS